MRLFVGSWTVAMAPVISWGGSSLCAPPLDEKVCGPVAEVGHVALHSSIPANAVAEGKGACDADKRRVVARARVQEIAGVVVKGKV